MRPASVNKYGNRQHAASDGRVFASKRECKVYEDLRLLEKMEKIYELVLQPKWELIPKQPGERAVTYTADFQYRDVQDSKLHVLDAKGARTQQFIIRRKLMLWIHKIRVEEV